MHHQHSLKHKIKNFFIITFIIVMGCTVAAFAATRMMNGQEAGSNGKDDGKISTISPSGHQAIKASVLDTNPSAYKINVKKIANMNVNEEAPTFAVYIKGSLPGRCGDFRKLELPYKKPTKYEREFNLSQHKEVLDALNRYGCVVMRNIPPAKG